MAHEVKITMLIKVINNEALKQGVRPISYRRYMQLAAEDIVPKPIHGDVDPIIALVHLFFYHRRLAEGSGSLSLTDERTGLTSIRKQQELLKLESMRGNLVERKDALKWLRQVVIECRSALVGFPRRMSEVLAIVNDAKEIEFMLREEIYRILMVLSNPVKNEGNKRKGNDPKRSKGNMDSTERNNRSTMG